MQNCKRGLAASLTSIVLLGCSGGPLAPAPAFDAGPAPSRELPHSWVEPVFSAAPIDADAAQPDQEPVLDAGADAAPPDAGHESAEACREDCTRSAGQLYALRAGRLAFIEDQQLFLQRLPDGEPELLEDLSELVVPTLDLDDQHLVFADDEHRELIVIELASGERRALPYADQDGRIAGALSVDTPYVGYSLDLPPSSNHAWADEWEVFVTDLEREASRVVGPHRLTIQFRPVLRGNVVVWEDDRHGHHNWDLPFFHQFELMSARLDMDDKRASLYKRDREDVMLYAFDGRNALIASIADIYAPTYLLVDVFDKETVELNTALEPGDTPLFVLGDLLLVARMPSLAKQCYLELVDLASEARVAISERGQCPLSAQTDGEFVAWAQGTSVWNVTDSFYRDVRGLLPER